MNGREITRRVHLVLGLSLGALFVVTGITGSLLVFYPEIDMLLTPAIRRVPADARPASYEAVYRALRNAHPERPEMWRIEIPSVGGAMPARSLAPADRAGRQFAPLIAWVDPRDGRVVRSAVWGESDYLVTWIYDLHYRLRLGKAGARVMGIVGIAILGLLASGIVLWWPRPGSWLRALRIRFGTLARQARLREIHAVTGILSLALLVIIVVTGVMMSIPESVRPLIARISPLDDTRVPPSRGADGEPRIALDAAVAAARSAFPGAPLRWIETPDGPAGVFRVTFYQPGEASWRFPQTNVWIDQYSAEVVAIRNPLHLGAGDTVLNWLHGVHKGEAFGLPGRLVAFLAGLTPLLLFVTGAWFWIGRPTKTDATKTGATRTGATRTGGAK